MSGPVRTDDVPPDGPPAPGEEEPPVQVVASREATVGDTRVLRALPRRGHRTVGAWCFADHMAPPPPGGGGNGGGARLDIGPHPHTALQTVTWLLDGEVLHRDSLGSEQLIRPGQLNLMTAGRGVAHAEETPPGAAAGGAQGVQLWVAQPEETRHGPPAFEHHPQLPVATIGGAVATVLVGELAGAESPARRDTDHLGADLVLPGGRATLPLRAGYEHALVVLEGALSIEDAGGPTGPVGPGHLVYLAPGRHEVTLSAPGPARALLLGGVPFPEPIVMWWNFVARSHDEVDAARRDWEAGADRFGPVASRLPRIPAPPAPPWTLRPR